MIEEQWYGTITPWSVTLMEQPVSQAPENRANWKVSYEPTEQKNNTSFRAEFDAECFSTFSNPDAASKQTFTSKTLQEMACNDDSQVNRNKRTYHTDNNLQTNTVQYVGIAPYPGLVTASTTQTPLVAIKNSYGANYKPDIAVTIFWETISKHSISALTAKVEQLEKIISLKQLEIDSLTKTNHVNNDIPTVANSIAKAFSRLHDWS
jgi:hypothetical protein